MILELSWFRVHEEEISQRNIAYLDTERAFSGLDGTPFLKVTAESVWIKSNFFYGNRIIGGK